MHPREASVWIQGAQLQQNKEKHGQLGGHLGRDENCDTSSDVGRFHVGEIGRSSAELWFERRTSTTERKLMIRQGRTERDVDVILHTFLTEQSFEQDDCADEDPFLR